LGDQKNHIIQREGAITETKINTTLVRGGPKRLKREAVSRSKRK